MALVSFSKRISSTLSRRKIVIFLSNYGTLIGMILIFPIFGLLKPSFLSTQNLLNILRQSATFTLLGLGLTFVLAAGMFDISIAAVCGLCNIAMAFMMAGGYGFVPGMLVAVLIGLSTGAINGFLVSKLHINDFLTTVAMMFVALGLELLLDKGTNVIIDEQYIKPLQVLGKGSILGIPIASIFLIIIAVIAYILLERSKFGRELYSLGGNSRSAFLSGVKVERLKFLAFLVCGFIVAMSAVMLTARLAEGKSRGAEAMLGDGIAAACIGQTFIRRGRPHVIGTILGGLFLATLANGFSFLNIAFYYQYLVRGIAIIFAVSFSGIQLRRK